MADEQQIVRGVSLSASGEATVDPALADELFTLALSLEERTNLPVDVEHVVAALVLASRHGEIPAERQIVGDDDSLTELLTSHVETVFSRYGGSVGSDD